MYERKKNQASPWEDCHSPLAAGAEKVSCCWQVASPRGSHCSCGSSRRRGWKCSGSGASLDCCWTGRLEEIMKERKKKKKQGLGCFAYVSQRWRKEPIEMFYWRSKTTSRSPALTMLRVVEILKCAFFFLLLGKKYFKMINTTLIFVLKMYSFGAHSSSAGRASVPWTEDSSSLQQPRVQVWPVSSPSLSLSLSLTLFPVISSAVLLIKPWMAKKKKEKYS